MNANNTNPGQKYIDHANLIRERIEGATNLADHFADGVYGIDEHGNMIVGYGVYGSANITVGADRVRIGGWESEPFTPETSRELTAFIAALPRA